ncbi:helix-turn-helix transcriptional regulator [Thalassospira tepidiphila]|uniref:helix-turn-helix transcriptional regulator n=1 Tax=Thalassospira tepidiphila TaxID=393657 RepID=UPI003AA8E13D
MVELSRILDLISLLYDLPYRESDQDWQEVLDRFLSTFGFSFGSVDLYAPLQGTFEKSIRTSSYSKSEEFARVFSAEFMETDLRAYQAVAAYRDHIFRSDDEVMGISRSQRHNIMPASKALYQVFGIEERHAVCLNTHGAWADVLTVQLTEKQRSVPQSDWKMLKALLPHWAKSFELYRTFNQLRLRFETILAGLDRLQLGVCVLTPNGEVILKNEEARRIVGDARGLEISRAGKMILSSDAHQNAFDQALGSARDVVSGQGMGKSAVLAVPRPGGESPCLVEVTPLRDDTGVLQASCRGIIVLLVDPDNTESISTKGMELLYGLTQAESEVCALVAKGLTTPQISDARNTSVETAKSQVKRVMEKTNTKSRVQLVRLAHHVNVPISKS